MAIVIFILALRTKKERKKDGCHSFFELMKGFSSTLRILLLFSPHHIPELSKGQCHWGLLPLTVWPLGSNFAVLTKAVTVLLGRHWLSII